MALGLLKPSCLALGTLLCTHASGVVPKDGLRVRTCDWEETCHSAAVPRRRIPRLSAWLHEASHANCTSRELLRSQTKLLGT